LPPLKVFVATGDQAGQEVDYVAAREGKPTIYAFVQADKWDRPVARFLRTLDEELSKDRKEIALVIVWLTDDVEKGKDYLPRAQESVKLAQGVWTVYPGTKDGPGGWGLNDSLHLTAVIADQGEARAGLGYRSLNETNVPEVLAKLPPRR
jgi:hypothetical protein